MFSTVNDVLRYLPAFRAYTWRMLEEIYEDNVMYAEVRMDFKEVSTFVHAEKSLAMPHALSLSLFCASYMTIVDAFSHQSGPFVRYWLSWRTFVVYIRISWVLRRFFQHSVMPIESVYQRILKCSKLCSEF